MRGMGDLSGIISKAKEELTKSKSRHDLRNLDNCPPLNNKQAEVSKKSENELQWDSLLESLERPLQICDLDFTDLDDEEDYDPLVARSTGSISISLSISFLFLHLVDEY